MAIFLNFRSTNDEKWLWFKFCNCGAVGVYFLNRHMCLVLLIIWYFTLLLSV